MTVTFDIKKDIELIAAGTHFWCKGHSNAVLITEKSEDYRYCKECFKLLIDEALMMTERGIKSRPSWIPRPGATTPPTAEGNGAGVVTGAIKGNSQYPNTVTDKIRDLSRQSFPSRAIQAELKKDGINISYRTICRILKAVPTNA